jgi:predicted HTH domain antitoxin
VNHISTKAGREALINLDYSKILQIVDTAFCNGATAINLSPTNRMYHVLRQMKEEGYQKEFGIYLMLPDMERFRDAMLQGGPMAVASELLSGMGWMEKLSSVAKGAVALLKKDIFSIMSQYFDIEIKRLSHILPAQAKVRCVLAHEQVTDLALSLKSDDLMRDFIQLVSEKGFTPGFVTRNFPMFTHYMTEIGVDLRNVIVMTPFNKIGFQMVPSKEECERALEESDTLNVIAISILGSGQINLKDAAEYIKKLERVDSVAVGVSSITQAKETFKLLEKVFGDLESSA